MEQELKEILRTSMPDNLNRLSKTLPEEEVEKIETLVENSTKREILKADVEPLAEWFMELLIKFKSYRDVEVPNDRAMAILKTLTEDNFPYWRRKTAEYWILKGNWQYKKGTNLELADFYPIASNFADNPEFVYFKADIQAVINEIYRDIHKIFYAKIREETTRFNQWQLQRELLDYNKSNLELLSELVKLQMELKTKSDEIIALEKDVKYYKHKAERK